MPKFDTLFLDRDGVINKKLEGRYVRDWEEFQFIPKVCSTIGELSKKFERIIIITNQQGVGKGIMSKDDLDRLHKRMVFEIEKKGGKIDKIYFCLHLEKDNCNCRKPKIGMIENAINDFPSINLQKAYLIGDSLSDIQAGEKAGIKSVRVGSQFTLFDWNNQL